MEYRAVFQTEIQANKFSIDLGPRHVYDPYSHVMRVSLYPTRLADNGEYRQERQNDGETRASQQSLQSIIYQ